MTLYELKEEYRELLALAEDPDTDPDVFRDTMDALSGEIEEKADAYAVVMDQLDADEELIDREIKRLTARKKSLAENKTRMKANLLDAMTVTGKRKFKTALHSFSVAKNPASVVMEVSDWHYVPADYLKQKDPDIDKAKLKAALQAGADLTGICHLEQTERVNIR